MLNFEYYNPTKIQFGKDVCTRLGRTIQSMGCHRVILIGGGGSAKKNGAYEQVATSLQDAKIEWIESWGVQANPEIEKVREMITLAKDFNADAVLALGGGSVIDSAKSVAAGVFVQDVWKLFLDLNPIEDALPVFTVLTISGTCSEMNSSAVVTNAETRQKWHIKGPALFPKVSFIDPIFQLSLPWRQTVYGALDAMSHITEFYFVDERAETTLSINESLCNTIIKMVDRLKNDPEDYYSRASLAWASTLAFNGTSGAGLGTGDFALHGIEHAVSAVQPDVPHGAGMGVLFLAWATYCMDANPRLFDRWAKQIWGKDDAKSGVEAMRAKIRSWGSAVTLSELGVQEADIEEVAQIAASAKREGFVKRILLPDIQAILKMAL